MELEANVSTEEVIQDILALTEFEGKPLPVQRKIRALTVLKGISWQEVAHQNGLTRSAIYDVMKGKTISPRIRKLIADTLEVPYEDLWGKETRRKS